MFGTTIAYKRKQCPYWAETHSSLKRGERQGNMSKAANKKRVKVIRQKGNDRRGRYCRYATAVKNVPSFKTFEEASEWLNGVGAKVNRPITAALDRALINTSDGLTAEELMAVASACMGKSGSCKKHFKDFRRPSQIKAFIRHRTVTLKRAYVLDENCLENERYSFIGKL